MSDCIRRLRRAASHGAKNELSIGSAESDVQRQPAVASRVTSATGRAEQRGKRRPRDALARSVWMPRLVFSGADATSDFIRRLERGASRGAKNSHSIGSAESDVQRQPVVPRP